MSDVWQDTTNSNVEMLVTMGRIEEKLSHLANNSEKSETASIGFQQTVQGTFSEHSEKLTRLDGRVKVIEESMRASFTKSTVIVGLAFTAVNIGFGIFGKYGLNSNC